MTKKFSARVNFVFFHTVLQCAVCEKWKTYCHLKKFRQINYLVFPLVKVLLSRNFCQRSVTVNFRGFPQCVKFTKFFYHLRIMSWNRFCSKRFDNEIVFTEIFKKSRHKNFVNSTVVMGPSQNFHGSSISSQNFSSRVEFRAKNFRATFESSQFRA